MNVLSGIAQIYKFKMKRLEKFADRGVEKSERIKIDRSASGIGLIKLIALPCILFLEQNAN